MSSKPLVIKRSLFDSIHINEQGAVVYGNNRTVRVDSCFFHDITTTIGGSCIDLGSSSLEVIKTCFSFCKNTDYLKDDRYANVIKCSGNLLNMSRSTSFQCADAFEVGDSSIFTNSIEVTMSDNNATSNINPRGASSLKAISVLNKKKVIITRSIDINSANYTTFEILREVDLSYSCIVNSSRNQYVIECQTLYMNWCIFIKQCSQFDHYTPMLALNCYTDVPRSVLSSTVSLFQIPFSNIDLLMCARNVGNQLNSCQFSKRNMMTIIIFLINSSLDYFKHP